MLGWFERSSRRVSVAYSLTPNTTVAGLPRRVTSWGRPRPCAFTHCT